MLGGVDGQTLPRGRREHQSHYTCQKASGSALSRQDEDTNRKIAGDRIIVETSFGRQCMLLMVVSNKFRFSEGNYDPIFLFMLAMTVG